MLKQPEKQFHLRMPRSELMANPNWEKSKHFSSICWSRLLHIWAPAHQRGLPAGFAHPFNKVLEFKDRSSCTWRISKSQKLHSEQYSCSSSKTVAQLVLLIKQNTAHLEPSALCPEAVKLAGVRFQMWSASALLKDWGPKVRGSLTKRLGH